MAKKLFVSNLDFEITVDQLREMFNEIGGVVSVVIATDRETKRSKGFAFVEMETDEAAASAIQAINNKTVNGRPVKVVEDRGKGGGDNRESSASGERPKFEPLPAIQRTQLFKRKRKLDPFIQNPSKSVDYKDTKLLSKFISERGKILSRRLTGLTAYNQRKVSKAIKRAQNLGLMPSSTV
jgi:small subunit ribosomal protein S18